MKIFDPISNSNTLHLPDAQSEADLQAELYARLTHDGFRVRSEVTYKKFAHAWFNSTFDLCVFKGKDCIAVLETKRFDLGGKADLKQVEQLTRYRHFGVPVILFWDLEKYDELVCFLRTGESERTEDFQVESEKDKLIRRRVKSLNRRLDVASMAAYDVNVVLPNSPLAFMEKTLEEMRDKVAEQQKELK